MKKPTALLLAGCFALLLTAAAAKPALVGFKLGESFNSSDLNRIETGDQVGILKIRGEKSGSYFWEKRTASGSERRAWNSDIYAEISDADRQYILAGLHIRLSEVPDISRNIIARYASLTGPQRLGAIALLGTFLSFPNGQIAPLTEAQMFLRRLMLDQPGVEAKTKIHRMAVTALALAPATDPGTIDDVVKFLGRTTNSYESFTTHFFFRRHKKELPSDIKARLLATGNAQARDIAEKELP